MALSDDQIQSLLGLVSSVESDNSDCDTCFDNLAEFAEMELAGAEIPEALASVGRHLQQCPCCKDEYNALLDGLRAMREAE